VPKNRSNARARGSVHLGVPPRRNRLRLEAERLETETARPHAIVDSKSVRHERKIMAGSQSRVRGLAPDTSGASAAVKEPHVPMAARGEPC